MDACEASLARANAIITETAESDNDGHAKDVSDSKNGDLGAEKTRELESGGDQANAMPIWLLR